MLVTFEFGFVLLNLTVELKRREEFKLVLQCLVQIREILKAFRQSACIPLIFTAAKHLNT